MTTYSVVSSLANLTLQANRQRKVIGYRLAQHPTTDLSLSPSSTLLAGSPSYDEVRLVPDPAHWDDFDEDLHPENWPLKKKILASLLVTQISWLVQFASAIDASVVEGIEAKFNVGPYVSALATGLFLIGFALGAPIAGPMSEFAGRNPIYILSLFMFLLSTLTAAISAQLSWFLTARFAAGFFGSTPLVCAGGTISDLYSASDQLIAFPLYAASGFSGLAAGPAAGGIMAHVIGIKYPQMTEWATFIAGGALFLMVALLQPETYGPVLLKWKTSLIIKNMKPEERELAFPGGSQVSMTKDLKMLCSTLWVAFGNPIRIAIYEPIIMILTLNLSMIYLIVFTILPGYQTIFTDIYKFTSAERGITFYGLAVGMFIALCFALGLAKYWRRHFPGPTLPGFEPEGRFDYAFLGQPAIAVSLFWMGFTAREGITPWSPIMASVLLGFGVLCVFMSSYMYIIHAYGRYAASGLVFITLVRYLVAGGMVVAGVGMFDHIGVAHTFTILGAVGTLLIPLPFLLFCFGCRLRMKSILSAGSH